MVIVHLMKCQTSRRRSVSESSLCNVSFCTSDNSRSLIPDSNKCNVSKESVVKRMFSYTYTTKVSSTRPKLPGRVLTSAESNIMLMEEKKGRSRRKRKEEAGEKEKRRRLREENKRNKESKLKSKSIYTNVQRYSYSYVATCYI